MKSLKNYKRIVSLVLSISIASSVLTPAFAQAGVLERIKAFKKNLSEKCTKENGKKVLILAAPIIPILVGVSYFALRSKNTSPINLESVIPVNLTSALPTMENISPAIASVMPSVVSAAPAVTSLFAKTFAMISPYGKVALSGAKFGLKKAFGGACLLVGIAVPLFILWQLVLKKKINDFIGEKKAGVESIMKTLDDGAKNTIEFVEEKKFELKKEAEQVIEKVVDGALKGLSDGKEVVANIIKEKIDDAKKEVKKIVADTANDVKQKVSDVIDEAKQNVLNTIVTEPLNKLRKFVPGYEESKKEDLESGSNYAEKENENTFSTKNLVINFTGQYAEKEREFVLDGPMGNWIEVEKKPAQKENFTLKAKFEERKKKIIDKKIALDKQCDEKVAKLHGSLSEKSQEELLKECEEIDRLKCPSRINMSCVKNNFNAPVEMIEVDDKHKIGGEETEGVKEEIKNKEVKSHEYAEVKASKVTKGFWDYVPFAKKSVEVFSGISKIFSKEEVVVKKKKLTAKDKRLKKTYGSQWKQKQNKS